MTGSRFWLNVQARRAEDEMRVRAARVRASDETRIRIHALHQNEATAAGAASENPAETPDGGTPSLTSSDADDASSATAENVDAGITTGFDGGANGSGVSGDDGANPTNNGTQSARHEPMPTGTLYSHWVEVLSPGEVFLILEDDEGGIDQIMVQAANAQQLHLLEIDRLATELDARLPEDFGALTRETRELGIAAADRCGGALLAIDALELKSSTEDVCGVQQRSALTFELTPQSLGNTQIEVVPHVEQAWPTADSGYAMRVVSTDEVDRMRLEVAAVDGNTALVWARAFASDVEIIGLSYAWDATDRVDLDRTTGPWVRASLYIPAEDEAPDDRPAEITATWQDEVAEIDLLRVRENEVNRTRLPPVSADDFRPSVSCLDEPCDPAGAALFGGWFCLRRTRRRRRAPAPSTPDA